MVPHLPFTIRDFAKLFDRYHDAPREFKMHCLSKIPLPVGTRFEPKTKNDKNEDQDRVNFPIDFAVKYKRIYGYVASLRHETSSANTSTSASAQIVTKLCWYSENHSQWQHGFFRVTAYSAAYSPQIVDKSEVHLLLGDAIVGIVERPSSERNSTNLIAWQHATSADWEFHAPYSRFSPAEKEYLLCPKTTNSLPQLGGQGFASNNRFHMIPSLRLQTPTLPTEVMRAVSGYEGTLAAVDAYIRDFPPPRCNCRCSCSNYPLPVGNAAASSSLNPEYFPPPRGPPPRFPPSIAEEIDNDSPHSVLDVQYRDDRASVGGTVTHISGTYPSIEDAMHALTRDNISLLNNAPVTRLHPNTDVFDMATSTGPYVVLQVTFSP